MQFGCGPVPPVTDDHWQAMVAALVGSGLLDARGAVADRFVAEHLDDAAASPADLVQQWQDNAAVFVAGALQHRLPATDEDDAVGVRLGCDRANAGIPVAELLQSVLLQERLCAEMAQDLVPPLPHKGRMLLELLSLLQAWASWFMIGLTAGHREAELAISRRDQELQDAFVWQLLSGPHSELENGSGIEAFGMSRSAEYHAFRARVTGPRDREALEAFLPVVGETGRRTGMMAIIDGDALGFVSRVPDATPPVPIGISAALPLDQLPRGFRQATRALEATIARGLVEMASLESTALHAAVVADSDVGRLLHAKYLAPVLALGPAGTTIVDTVRSFVLHCGRLEPTARELAVHPNTVRYRLGRFEAINGCSLHSSDAIAEIWWALTWSALPVGPDTGRGPAGRDLAGPAARSER